ncbi:MAG: lysoplasmalogenase family protein, partial [Lachnospiraceae bacterium]|nr:lysoplasmalogenase family protein [Lachnospiraceae bacterium]
MLTASPVLFICFLAAAVIIALIFTIRRGTKTDAVSLLLKTIASLLFILLGLTGCFFSSLPVPMLALFMVFGLVCGLIGDIYLDMKFVYPKDETLNTFTGFGAFMLGHCFYTIFLFSYYKITLVHLLISIAAGIVIGIAIFVTPKLMKLNYGRYRVISSIYAGLLVFVTVYALLLEVAAGHSVSKLLFFIGIVLFLLSDLILSQIYFG